MSIKKLTKSLEPLRKAKGIGIAEMGEVVGSNQTVYNLESGKNITLETLVTYLDYLGYELIITKK